MNEDGDLQEGQNDDSDEVSTADFSLEADAFGITSASEPDTLGVTSAQPETVIIEEDGGVDTVYETLYSTTFATQTNEAPSLPAVATVLVQAPVTTKTKAPCTKNKKPVVTSVPVWSTRVDPIEQSSVPPITSTRTKPRGTYSHTFYVNTKY